MMLGAPPRAKPDSLATSIASPKVTTVSIVFMSNGPMRLEFASDFASFIDMGTMSDAHEPANTHRVDRRLDFIPAMAIGAIMARLTGQLEKASLIRGR